MSERKKLDYPSELYNGWHVPTGVFGKPFFDAMTRDGLSKHCEKHVEACLNALPTHRRNVAVDGGAYVGIWSAHLVRHFKRVVAFEPVEVNADLCKRNMEKRVPAGKHFQLEHHALSDSERVDFITDIGKPYGARFALPTDEVKPEQLLTVATVALDQYDFGALDLLKLDVEGHEYEALQGAEQTIRRHRPVIMIEEKLDPAKRASKFLGKLGWRCIWRRKYDLMFIG